MKPLRSMFLSFTRVPPLVLLAGIVLLAFMVAWLVTSRISSGEQEMAAKQREMENKMSAKTTVVYSTKDIPEGQTIPSEALEERQVETNRAPEDALAASTLATGRVAKYGISAGQIVSQHDLQPQGMSMGFEQRLKPGFRAVTFAVDNNSGVAGFVTPESHIDIIGMVGAGADTKAKPILSDVEVIAVGQTYQKQPGTSTAQPASSVTVAVTPEDTTKLIKGVIASKLYLSLRNAHDHEPVATVDVTSLYDKPNTLRVSNMNMGGIAVPPPPAMPTMMGHHTDDDDDAPGPALASAGAPMRPDHQIEAWSGGKKDMITVPER